MLNPEAESISQGAETWAPRSALTVERTKEFRQELAAVIGRTEQLWVDLRAVAEIDTAGMQLLCSAHRTAAALGRTLGMVGTPAPEVVRTLGEAGFIRHVGCALKCSGSCLWKGLGSCGPAT